MSIVFMPQEIWEEFNRQALILIAGFGDRMDVSAPSLGLDGASFNEIRSTHKEEVDLLCELLLKQKSKEESEEICIATDPLLLSLVSDRMECGFFVLKNMLPGIPFGVVLPDGITLENLVTNTLILQKGAPHAA